MPGRWNGSQVFHEFRDVTETAAYKQDKASKYRKDVGYNTYNYRTNLDINLTKTTQVYMGLDGYISINNLPGCKTRNCFGLPRPSLPPYRAHRLLKRDASRLW